MSRAAANPAKTRTADRTRVPIEIIAVEIKIDGKRVAVIGIVWREAGGPGIKIRRKIGFRQWAGIRTVGLIVHVIVVSPLVHGPVATGKRSGDQDKLNAGGLFHNGVGYQGLIKIPLIQLAFSYPIVISSLFNRYPVSVKFWLKTGLQLARKLSYHYYS
jgi:hypothetical protein